MFDDDQDGDLLEPPKYDMIAVRFRGDDHTIVLPYCEVANGDITEITAEEIQISVIKADVLEKVKMAHVDFLTLIESAFDIKEIKELGVQLAGSHDTHTII